MTTEQQRQKRARGVSRRTVPVSCQILFALPRRTARLCEASEQANSLKTVGSLQVEAMECCRSSKLGWDEGCWVLLNILLADDFVHEGSSVNGCVPSRRRVAKI